MEGDGKVDGDYGMVLKLINGFIFLFLLMRVWGCECACGILKYEEGLICL
jgi:hypothetical protein